jgi:hypothetical protein
VVFVNRFPALASAFHTEITAGFPGFSDAGFQKRERFSEKYNKQNTNKKQSETRKSGTGFSPLSRRDFKRGRGVSGRSPDSLRLYPNVGVPNGNETKVQWERGALILAGTQGGSRG